MTSKVILPNNNHKLYLSDKNLLKLISNVKKLAYFKKKLGFSRPKIVWKFVIFDHNKHEVNIVKEKYKLFGFDSYEFIQNRQGVTARAKIQINRKKRTKKVDNCYWLWHIMVIQSDGQVNACCNQKDFKIGNAFETNTHELWNNNTYQNLRNGFRKDNFPGKLHEHCKNCYRYNVG